MNKLTIKDLNNSQILLIAQFEDGTTAITNPYVFNPSIDNNVMEEIRWYIEDFPSFPFGGEKIKAERVEKSLPDYGTTLFKEVFKQWHDTVSPFSLYERAISGGEDSCIICISSNRPEFLKLPWEIMLDPRPGKTYLSTIVLGFYRNMEGYNPSPTSNHDLDSPNRLNLLFIISRPFQKDVSFYNIAKPVIEELKNHNINLSLEVLRPPTFSRLIEALNKKQYDLIHFDGHGSFNEKTNLGQLVFEELDTFNQDLVDAEKIGLALSGKRQPLYILNACRSSEESSVKPFTSVATQLLATGAKAVVAMSYAVLVQSASFLMERIYSHILSGDNISNAISKARIKLFADSKRASIAGQINLKDWFIPVLYQQVEEHYPLSPEGAYYNGKESNFSDKYYNALEICPEGKFGFIGRHSEILKIERAFYKNDKPWLIISGTSGIGKSELANEFARWYYLTDGCNAGLVRISFKDNPRFAQILTTVIDKDITIASKSEEEQLDIVAKYYRSNQFLLILDNFESLNANSDERTRKESEKAKLNKFLKKLKGGKSRVLITTIKENEDWLDFSSSILVLNGLDRHSSFELAKQILDGHGIDLQDYATDQYYVRLIELLNGHPRSMEIILPHLKRHTPESIIQSLDRIKAVDSVNIIDASLNYSFNFLKETTQKLSLILSFFSSTVNLDVINIILNENPLFIELSSTFFGFVPKADDWNNMVDELTNFGLITSRGKDGQSYTLHPSFPIFLRQNLLQKYELEDITKLEVVFAQTYAHLSDLVVEKALEHRTQELFVIQIEENNFLRALNLGLQNHLIREVQAHLQAIGALYVYSNKKQEWLSILDSAEDYLNQFNGNLNSEQLRFWMFVVSNRYPRMEMVPRHELIKMRENQNKILNYLDSLANDTEEIDKNEWIAQANRFLARIELELKNFKEAETYHYKAINYFESQLRLGQNVEKELTDLYHQQGNIFKAQEKFSPSKRSYEKSIYYCRDKESPTLIITFFQLGRLHFHNSEMEAAICYLNQGINLCRKFKYIEELAVGQQELGRVKISWGKQLEKSELNRAMLLVKEGVEILKNAIVALSNRGVDASKAEAFCSMGDAHLMLNNLDESEEWYLQAQSIYENIGCDQEVYVTKSHLAKVFSAKQEYLKAESLIIEAIQFLERNFEKHNYDVSKLELQLACIQAHQKKYPEAISGFTRILIEKYSNNEMKFIQPIIIRLAMVSFILGNEAFHQKFIEVLNDSVNNEKISNIEKNKIENLLRGVNIDIKDQKILDNIFLYY